MKKPRARTPKFSTGWSFLAGILALGGILVPGTASAAGTLLLPTMSDAARKAIERKNEVQGSESELKAAVAGALNAVGASAAGTGAVAALEAERARLASQVRGRNSGNHAPEETRCHVRNSSTHSEISAAAFGPPEMKTVILRVGGLLEKDSAELPSERLAVQFRIARWAAGEKPRTVIRLIDINTEDGTPLRPVSLEALGLTAGCDEPAPESDNGLSETAIASRIVKPALRESGMAIQDFKALPEASAAGAAR